MAHMVKYKYSSSVCLRMAVADFVLNMSGMVGAFLVPLLIGFCWTANSFDLRKNTLSDCATTAVHRKLFDFSLVLTAVLQAVFTLAIINAFLPFSYVWIAFPLFLSAAFLMACALIDKKRIRISICSL